MSWAKLSDHFCDDPDTFAVGSNASWLFVCGIVYAARNLTDGFIPEGKARTLVGDLPDVDGLIARLCDERWRWWLRVDGGYQIRSYLKYNPSREQVLEERRKAKERMERLRGGKKGRSGARSGEQPPVRSGARSGRSSASPDPDPVPDPSGVDLIRDTGAYPPPTADPGGVGGERENAATEPGPVGRSAAVGGGVPAAVKNNGVESSIRQPGRESSARDFRREYVEQTLAENPEWVQALAEEFEREENRGRPVENPIPFSEFKLRQWTASGGPFTMPATAARQHTNGHAGAATNGAPAAPATRYERRVASQKAGNREFLERLLGQNGARDETAAAASLPGPSPSTKGGRPS